MNRRMYEPLLRQLKKVAAKDAEPNARRDGRRTIQQDGSGSAYRMVRSLLDLRCSARSDSFMQERDTDSLQGKCKHEPHL